MLDRFAIDKMVNVRAVAEPLESTRLTSIALETCLDLDDDSFNRSSFSDYDKWWVTISILTVYKKELIISLLKISICSM